MGSANSSQAQACQQWNENQCVAYGPPNIVETPQEMQQLEAASPQASTISRSYGAPKSTEHVAFVKGGSLF